MLIAQGWLAQAVLGSGTNLTGLPCAPTSPASMAVTVGTGGIFALENLDSTAYGSLAADTTASHQIVKQGLNLAVQTLPCPAPTTTGQSIVYLIEAAYQDYDTNSAVLQYFNSANPSQAFTGPGGTGTTQNTTRQGLCSVQVKAGTSAATGTQVAPSADAGYVGLYTVTVPFGASTVTSGNIATVVGAPFIPYTLPTVRPGFTQSQEFPSNGTFTVPANVSTVGVKVWGAGGGGGSTNAGGSGGAGGGAGGGYSQKTITGLTPGTTISITVGTGGSAAGGGGSSVGGTGGTSLFGSYCSATGGSGGTGNGFGNGGGTPGAGSGGDINLSGAGGQGSVTSGTGIGGSGGAAALGGGGGGGGYGAPSVAGMPGGGGGGCGSSTNQTGGAGASGLVIVEW